MFQHAHSQKIAVALALCLALLLSQAAHGVAKSSPAKAPSAKSPRKVTGTSSKPPANIKAKQPAKNNGPQPAKPSLLGRVKAYFSKQKPAEAPKSKGQYDTVPALVDNDPDVSNAQGSRTLTLDYGDDVPAEVSRALPNQADAGGIRSQYGPAPTRPAGGGAYAPGPLPPAQRGPYAPGPAVQPYGQLQLKPQNPYGELKLKPNAYNNVGLKLAANNAYTPADAPMASAVAQAAGNRVGGGPVNVAGASTYGRAPSPGERNVYGRAPSPAERAAPAHRQLPYGIQVPIGAQNRMCVQQGVPPTIVQGVRPIQQPIQQGVRPTGAAANPTRPPLMSATPPRAANTLDFANILNK